MRKLQQIHSAEGVAGRKGDDIASVRNTFGAPAIAHCNKRANFLQVNGMVCEVLFHWRRYLNLAAGETCRHEQRNTMG